MKLQDYLRLNVAQAINSARHANWQKYGQMTSSEIYQEIYFLTPFIRCKDGFGISIQINNGNYCVSENGYRQFGKTWIKAEWGFPTKPIEAVKYNADDINIYDDEYNIVGTREFVDYGIGSCSVELLQELLDEHGGIDVERICNESLENFYEKS